MTRQEWRIQVKIALMQKDITQSDLSKMVGATRGYVNCAINDTLSTPGHDIIRKISKALGVDVPDGIEKEGGEDGEDQEVNS